MSKFEEKNNPVVHKQKGYVDTDFPAYAVSVTTCLVSGMPSTYSPVPIANFCYENNASGVWRFCSPLCVYKGITVHFSYRVIAIVGKPFGMLCFVI
jgi:hypothetical protein